MLPELLCSHKRICGRYFPIYIPVLLFLKIDIEDLFTCFFYTLLGCLIEVSIYEKKQQMPSTIYRLSTGKYVSFYIHGKSIYGENICILCYSNGIIYIIVIIYTELFIQLNVLFVRVKTAESQVVWVNQYNSYVVVVGQHKLIGLF